MVLPLVKKLGIDTSQIAEFSQLEANIDKVLPVSAFLIAKNDLAFNAKSHVAQRMLLT